MTTDISYLVNKIIIDMEKEKSTLINLNFKSILKFTFLDKPLYFFSYIIPINIEKLRINGIDYIKIGSIKMKIDYITQNNNFYRFIELILMELYKNFKDYDYKDKITDYLIKIKKYDEINNLISEKIENETLDTFLTHIDGNNFDCVISEDYLDNDNLINVYNRIESINLEVLNNTNEEIYSNSINIHKSTSLEEFSIREPYENINEEPFYKFIYTNLFNALGME